MDRAASPTAGAPARFDRIASNYETSEVHKGSASIDLVHRLVQQNPLRQIADIACGAGHFGLSFLSRADVVAFCDASPNMLAAVQRLGSATDGARIELHECYAEALPLCDDWADLTVSRLAPHHFSDILESVREMVRVTRPGGRIAVIDLEGFPDPAIDAFNHRLELLHDPTHVRSYTTARWTELFRDAGARIDYVQGGLHESSDGVPISRWCQIASSGSEAEIAINAALTEADSATLASLGVWRDAVGFRMPVRTTLIFGTVPMDQPCP